MEFEKRETRRIRKARKLTAGQLQEIEDNKVRSQHRHVFMACGETMDVMV